MTAAPSSEPQPGRKPKARGCAQDSCLSPGSDSGQARQNSFCPGTRAAQRGTARKKVSILTGNPFGWNRHGENLSLKFWARKSNIDGPPSQKKKKHNQEHNTIGAHITVFEMALGRLWPFGVPNKYIRRGARHRRTNPNDTATRFPWMSPNTCAAE